MLKASCSGVRCFKYSSAHAFSIRRCFYLDTATPASMRIRCARLRALAGAATTVHLYTTSRALFGLHSTQASDLFLWGETQHHLGIWDCTHYHHRFYYLYYYKGQNAYLLPISVDNQRLGWYLSMTSGIPSLDGDAWRELYMGGVCSGELPSPRLNLISCQPWGSTHNQLAPPCWRMDSLDFACTLPLLTVSYCSNISQLPGEPWVALAAGASDLFVFL